jgi:hypothetical protein
MISRDATTMSRSLEFEFEYDVAAATCTITCSRSGAPAPAWIICMTTRIATKHAECTPTKMSTGPQRCYTCTHRWCIGQCTQYGPWADEWHSKLRALELAVSIFNVHVWPLLGKRVPHACCLDRLLNTHLTSAGISCCLGKALSQSRSRTRFEKHALATTVALA